MIMKKSYRAELREIVLDVIISQFRCKSTYKDLSMSRFGFLGINFLVVNSVFTGSHNFIDRFGFLKDYESEAPRPSGCGICLNINAIYLTILSKMFS